MFCNPLIQIPWDFSNGLIDSGGFAPGNKPMTQVTATPAAAELIGDLIREHGEIIFHLSGGCCDGSAPMCFAKGEFLIGSVDVLIGQVCGCDFYIAESTYQYYKNNVIEIDVTAGRGSSFSIEAPRGLRFLIRSSVVNAG